MNLYAEAKLSAFEPNSQSEDCDSDSYWATSKFKAVVVVEGEEHAPALERDDAPFSLAEFLGDISPREKVTVGRL